MHPLFVGSLMESSQSDFENFERSFRPLIGLPCWNARRTHGSSMIKGYGEPHLRIWEPMKTRRHRLVTPTGRRSLWIYHCAWAIGDIEKQFAHSESTSDEMDRAIESLNGQAVASLDRPSKPGTWKFDFDMGGVLVTWPDDDDSQHWNLDEPDGWSLTSHATGTLLRHREVSQK